MTRVRLRHRLEYAGIRLLELLVRALPEGVADRMGAGLGWLVGPVLGVRRRVVRENLARAFPDRRESWRRKVARDSYRHLGREAVAMLRLAGTSREELARRGRFEGWEPLEGALSLGEGALLLTGHVGNWEVAGAIVAVQADGLTVVARKQANPLFDEHLNRTRSRLGMEVVEEGRAVRRVVEELRSGEAVALVADQNVRKGGVFVDFFGVPAATARGPALFALRSGAPVFLVVGLREPAARARYRVLVRPLPLERTGDREADVRRLMAAFSAGLEEIVREVPAQYFWQHKRWKTRPPEEGRGPDERAELPSARSGTQEP